MNLKRKLVKKGVSPVIATVLLISMVVVIAAIIFIWFRAIGKEVITKFGKNVELACDDVEFNAEYTSANGILSIVNTGNVPIYSVKLKIGKDRGYVTKDIRDVDSNWKDSGLLQGGVFVSQDLSSLTSGAETLLIIPTLLGESDKGERVHVCAERNGFEVVV